jgi:hypothetical protein
MAALDLVAEVERTGGIVRGVPIPDKPPAHVQAIANFFPNGRAAGGFGRDPRRRPAISHNLR